MKVGEDATPSVLLSCGVQYVQARPSRTFQREDDRTACSFKKMFAFLGHAMRSDTGWRCCSITTTKHARPVRTPVGKP
jgi:hypothetical protein